MRKLAQKAGSDDRQTLVLRQQYAIELGTNARKDLHEVQIQKKKLEAMLKVRRPEALHETAAATISHDAVERLIEQDPEVSDLKARLDAASEQLASEKAYTGRVAKNTAMNPVLKTLRDEVELTKRQLDRKRKAIRPFVLKQLQNPQDDGQSVKDGSLEQQLAVATELEASLQEEVNNFTKI